MRWKLNDGSKRNYAFYQYLVQCAGDRPELVAKSRDLLKTLDGQIGEKERAPLLALLKVEKDSRAMTDDEWFEMVQTYWKRWGSKGCVVSELEGVVGDDELRMGRQVRMLETRTKEGHVRRRKRCPAVLTRTDQREGIPRARECRDIPRPKTAVWRARQVLLATLRRRTAIR